MTVGKVYEFINSFAPFSAAEKWDNSGILIGDGETEINKILVALDCTKEVAEEAYEKGADLIVTHHPLIFDPLYNISWGSVVYKLIRNGISLISAHTNLDKAGVSLNMAKLLKLRNISGEGFVLIGECEAITAEGLAEKCKEVFSIEKPRYTSSKKDIRRIAVCSGSGGSEIREAAALGADAYITGDVKHDVFLEARNLGIALIDAGHYETEKIYMPVLAEKLRDLGVEVILSEKEQRPYEI